MDIFSNNVELVQIPNCVLYPHQKIAWNGFSKIMRENPKGVKYLILEWHRRGGKDIELINLTAKQASKEVGNYYYVFPEKRQAREAIFEGIDADGRRMIDYIPHQLIHRIRDKEMVIYIKTNQKDSKGDTVYSTIQFVGSDADTKVGTSLKGVVFSEYALCNPDIYYKLEPAVARANGFMAMISTPRGEDNHMVELINLNKDSPKAFIMEQVHIEKTFDYAGNRIFTVEDFEDKKRA